ncbi:hypothetical protein ACE41H_22595 [Paenibacillus enshidis]|uniref:Uncharacterized protein n=1 Tax=Paenibacillus enshidis TaxID=1458439 RepID=A0ABV5AZB1_9BACL
MKFLREHAIKTSKSLLAVSLLAVSVSGGVAWASDESDLQPSSQTAEYVVVGETAESSLESPIITITEPPAPPIPHFTQNDVTKVETSSDSSFTTMNQQKFVSVYRDFGLNESIPASIVYAEDNGSAGRWGGTLQRTNVVQYSNYVRVTYSGTVYKDID